MNTAHIESNLQQLIKSFEKDSFIYNLLLAYGISKTSITRLQKGDFNLSKIEGEVLYKNKVFFKTEKSDKLLFEIEEAAKEDRILKQNPRFIILTDFETIVAKDLKTKLNRDFKIAELPKYFDFFLPLTGAEVYKSSNDNKADRDAAYKLGQLYEGLVNDNPDYNTESHNLNVFLSRLLLCFFAEDTGIFKKVSIFTETVAQHTLDNGSNVHEFLDRLFKRLNTEKGDFPDYLERFPYVNGGLFRDNISSPQFSARSRKILLECGELNWSEINPDIFGSMIQAVADPEERSNLGMHYTSVPNIKKLIEPLFLDELYDDFQKNTDNASNLKKLINRISKIKFFDPACGSGNFLIITYKEIRLLEIEIIKRLVQIEKQGSIYFTAISLSQFYGIEIKDFAHEMAILSLWLAEHQMNLVFDEKLEGYGQSKPILPLKEAGQIKCANATRVSWNEICTQNINDEIYILGNPPYLGSFLQNKQQKEDLAFVCKGFKSYKDLDYISCWFIKATEYIQNGNSKFAFVTTNSICQGEQVVLLWPFILKKNLEIFFAYKSFKWTNNAKGNAGVFCTIIGLRQPSTEKKKIYGDGIFQFVKNINPYLTNGSTVIISKRMKPLSSIPPMSYGSKIVDEGNLIFSLEEKIQLIKKYPQTEKLFKKLTGSAEFIRGLERWCLYIDDNELDFAISIPEISKRLNAVSEFRKKSTEISTREMANVPHKFYYSVHNDSDSIIIPSTSSERREYVPIGFLDGETIISNAASVILVLVTNNS